MSTSTPSQPEQLVIELNRRLMAGEPMSNIPGFAFTGFELVARDPRGEPAVRVSYTYQGESGHIDCDLSIWDAASVTLDPEAVKLWANAYEATCLWHVIGEVTGGEEVHIEHLLRLAYRER